VLAVNLKSAFFGAQFAAQQFMAQGSGGLIVTISSTHEDWPMPGNIAYCVAKGGAKMLTRTAGVELGSLGIRLVNVAPRAVSTPINAVTEMDPELLRRLNGAIPLGRIARAAEIADVVVFLASDGLRELTFTTLRPAAQRSLGPILKDMDRSLRPLPGQLRDLVRAALGRQGLAIRRLRWMGQHTNHLFRCDTTAGERLVIRVCLPGGRSDAELDGELTWLAALARDTGLTIPAARFTTRVATPQLPDGGRCIGFGWIQGRPCGCRPSRRLVADLGRVIATLHSHAREFRPPPGFTRPAPDIRHLTWAGTWHAIQLARRPIDPEVRRVLAETAGRVDAVLARLGHDPAGYGLVHADLCLENILDHHGQARPIDFDDASWGHYALDLAIAADDIPRELHPVLLRGYQTVCPLPPGYHEHQAALLSARHLYLAIWHLANGLPDEDHLSQLRAFTAH